MDEQFVVDLKPEVISAMKSDENKLDELTTGDGFWYGIQNKFKPEDIFLPDSKTLKAVKKAIILLRHVENIWEDASYEI